MDKKKFWKRTYRFLLVWGIITLGFVIELLIESYPKLPNKLNEWIIILLIGPPLCLLVNMFIEYFVAKPAIDGLYKVSEKKIRTINKVLVGIIVVPILILLLIAVFLSLFK